VIPALVTLLFLGLAARVVVKGSVADAEAVNPASSADGVVRQLLLDPSGRKVARLAIVVDRPPAEVFAAITGYERYPEVFPGRVQNAKATTAADGKVHFTGDMITLVGAWPVDTTVAQSNDGTTFHATWDDAGGAFKVNRGGWTVTPAGSGSSLVVYSLDMEITGYPAFVVRYAILHTGRPILKELRSWIEKQPPAAKK
jgi:hypothetical protein